MTYTKTVSRRRLVVLCTALLAGIGVCYDVYISRPAYDPLDEIAGLAVDYNNTFVGRSGKGGPFIFQHSLSITEKPEYVRKALDKIVGERPGWRYEQYKGKGWGRYGSYVAMLKDTSYEIVISYNGDDRTYIDETRPATKGEGTKASIKVFFDGLLPQTKR